MTLAVMGVAALANGAVPFGLVMLAVAVFGLIRRLRIADDQEPNVKVVQPGVAVLIFLVGALWFGGLAVYSLRDLSSHLVWSTMLFLVGLGCISAALLFEGLRRTSMNAPSTLRGESVLAQGIGRSDKGIHGQVVAATSSRIVALPARLIGRPVIAASIPYETVEGFQADHDSLVVHGPTNEIGIKKCPPNQVAALASKLREHTSVEE